MLAKVTFLLFFFQTWNLVMIPRNMVHSAFVGNHCFIGWRVVKSLDSFWNFRGNYWAKCVKSYVIKQMSINQLITHLFNKSWFHEARRFITMFTNKHLLLDPVLSNSNPSHTISLRFILILSIHLCLSLSNWLLLWGFLSVILCAC